MEVGAVPGGKDRALQVSAEESGGSWSTCGRPGGAFVLRRPAEKGKDTLSRGWLREVYVGGTAAQTQAHR